MPGHIMPLFEDAKFLKAAKYPRVGIIYLTSNRKGGIIFEKKYNYCYMYDMSESGFVVGGTYLQCPGKWSRHLDSMEKRIFSLLLKHITPKNWRGTSYYS